ncbi:hypothetical protein SCP_0801970 [Sparassis crispa]|uniref:F-box domain-containing protein n=1 Tax=Sparassis crispa TaxID=139825 RepID=A0A401GTW7_9APHY|nr:hypothetical protein SCP_0801970 [Sparassis crispa]GBE85675.1 hypothetical protein SCP_0801970 [Sparassis crispa]
MRLSCSVKRISPNIPRRDPRIYHPGSPVGGVLTDFAHESTLATNQENAALVRKLSIDWTHHRVLGNLFRLLRHALEQLTSLHTLSVELSPDDNHFNLAWIFPERTFSLRTLSTSVRCDAPLARFLETQPRISELSLRGFQTSQPFNLNPSALPMLTSFRVVHAGTPVLSVVLKDRPIEGVSLSLFPDDGFLPLDTLRLPSRPIKRLTIMSLDSTPPNVLIPEVSVRLPRLEALHVVVLMAQYDYPMLQNSGPLLSHFSELRYLTFMSAVTATLDDEQEIAKLWHKACPTLKTIILPRGKVWFEREGKWTCCG